MSTVGIKLITGVGSNSLDNINKDSIITELLSRFVVSVDGKTDESAVQSFVRYMPAQDSRYLRKLYLQLMPNIDLTQKFVCAHCDHEESKEVLLDAGFFWPE